MIFCSEYRYIFSILVHTLITCLAPQRVVHLAWEWGSSNYSSCLWPRQDGRNHCWPLGGGAESLTAQLGGKYFVLDPLEQTAL